MSLDNNLGASDPCWAGRSGQYDMQSMHLSSTPFFVLFIVFYFIVPSVFGPMNTLPTSWIRQDEPKAWRGPNIRLFVLIIVENQTYIEVRSLTIKTEP